MNVRKQFPPRELSDEPSRPRSSASSSSGRRRGRGTAAAGPICSGVRRGRHHVRAGRDPLRHLFGPGAAVRRRLYGGDARPSLDARMDRGGAGGALGDRAIRDPRAGSRPWTRSRSDGSLPILSCGYAASPRTACRPWCIAAVGDEVHVDVGIVAARSRPPPTATNTQCASLRLMQVMAVAVVLREGGAVARPQHVSPVILDQHRLAREHDDELVLALMPVALADDRRRASA